MIRLPNNTVRGEPNSTTGLSRDRIVTSLRASVSKLEEDSFHTSVHRFLNLTAKVAILSFQDWVT